MDFSRPDMDAYENCGINAEDWTKKNQNHAKKLEVWTKLQKSKSSSVTTVQESWARGQLAICLPQSNSGTK